ncbi:hypothetical protein DGG96_07340 [Legionella qingyii]|uniref:Uncharacterized protein n=1 Tax=Legionella qingyii TaxID=2184757 RepID=A0A317U7C9_9GAMM|nr:hypothetical protein DGG96_07340 [Legionella qingyii]
MGQADVTKIKEPLRKLEGCKIYPVFERTVNDTTIDLVYNIIFLAIMLVLVVWFLEIRFWSPKKIKEGLNK